MAAINVDRSDTGAVVLELRGEYDTYMAHRLREHLDELQHEVLPLVVDLSGAVFLDSTTVGVLLQGLTEATARGTGFALLVPESASAPLRRMLELTRLDSFFPIAQSRVAAVELAREPRAREH